MFYILTRETNEIFFNWFCAEILNTFLLLKPTIVQYIKEKN